LATSFGFESHIEITLEANPGTVDMQAFQGFFNAGINRLSMGVQSLDTKELTWLERIHNSSEVYQAFDAARKASFNNINLDFMYGLPEQSLEQWQHSLDAALQFSPEHLSCYQLTVEPHTKLAARHASSPYRLPDDETSLAFFHSTRESLAKAGYEAYEISNFAKPDKYCRHNDGYWLYHDYIGIGAGASGKWDMKDGGTYRYSNTRTPEKYTTQAIQTGSAINNDESLALQQAAAEAVWVGLRRKNGIDNRWFNERFKQGITAYFQNDLEPWLNDHKLIWHGQQLQLAESGIPLADAIAESVL